MQRHRKANAFRDIGTPGDPRLLSAIERRTPGVAGGGINHFFGGTVITPPKKSRKAKTSTVCPFGKLVPTDDDPPKRAIAGGVIHCGDKNFNVDPQPVNTESDGTWLVQIFLDCKVNRDDDNEIILPGIETSDDTPQWDNKTWSEGTDYDDNENPDVSDGLGSVVIPVGKLTIKDGGIKFEPVACGNVTVNQCSGSFTLTRG